VHVDHLPYSAARSDKQFLIRIGSHHCSDPHYGSRSLAGILPTAEQGSDQYCGSGFIEYRLDTDPDSAF
jgi:hypothetical protein